MISHRDHLAAKMKNPKFQKLYEQEKELLDISIKILDTRQKRGLSQAELSKKARVTQQQISRVENGVNCTMLTFLKICDSLGIEIGLREKSI